MKKYLVLSLLVLGITVLDAQDFVVVQETSLSGAAEVVTVQQPASNSSPTRFVSGWIDCSVACTVTIEVNGTAASTTAITPAAVPGNSSTVKATAYRSSNVGTGTIIGKFALPAGGGAPIGLTGLTLTGNGTAKNLTIRTSSITGIVHINLRWTQVQQ